MSDSQTPAPHPASGQSPAPASAPGQPTPQPSHQASSISSPGTSTSSVALSTSSSATDVAPSSCAPPAPPSSLGVRSSSFDAPLPAREMLFAFLLINAVIRSLTLNFNMAEYTDGILQLRVFEIRAGLYPPLFGALAHLVALTGLPLEFAGRFVSAVAGTLTVIPVYRLAARLGGRPAAVFALLLYTISPMALRWSNHAMTDALFMMLCAFAMERVFESLRRVTELRGTPRDSGSDADAAQPPAPSAAASASVSGPLVVAILLGAAACLTRYQGAFLALPIAYALWSLVRAQRRIPWAPLVAGLSWLALPAWSYSQGFVHGNQFSERTAGQWIQTAVGYLNAGESFVLIAPYYFGYPIFVLALVGILRLRRLEGLRRAFAAPWLLFAVPLLLLHSTFASLQFRYMMPLLPAVVVLAGIGAVVAEQRLRLTGRRYVFSALMGLSILYLTVFSCAVLVFQRTAFGDQKEAALFVRENIPAGVPIVSNEVYGSFDKLECIKFTEWSGRATKCLLRYLPWRNDHAPVDAMSPGTIVTVSTAYGGDERADYQLGTLNFFYRMRMVRQGFEVSLIPILDDIMERPEHNQNALAWVLRYLPQDFSTHIYVIESMRPAEEIGNLMNRGVVPPGIRAYRPSDRATMVAELTELQQRLGIDSKISTAPKEARPFMPMPPQ